jgi:type I site-specific restriction endonuclease
MERASALRDVSQIKARVAKFKQQPRRGQLDAILATKTCGSRLNVKLPTGYGKTYTALSIYSVLQSLGEVNRLLVIFPTDAQLLQFEESAGRSMEKCCIEGPKDVCDIRFFGAAAIAKHQKNNCQVYGITVQSLIGSRGMDNVSTLLGRGRWMVVVDEYHHYGIDLPFGNAVNALSYEFLLCMSATPYRPGSDGAFGPPDVNVLYRDAVEELSVKPLRGHSYNYKVDAITGDNEVISFTTEELVAECGSDSPKAIEKMIYNRKLRWSPKYISPLVTNPLSRMIAERVRTGQPLQAIIGAMCVSHAEMVCEQIRSAFPDLRCEWVGTGEDGRSPETNRKILKEFAPTDDSRPTVDVLVHVGMAGEGLDTVYVSEVVHLNAASVNNTNNQENGRAARYLPGVVGNINFDAGSGYAKKQYVGDAIMDAMDNLPASPDEDDPQNEAAEKAVDEFYELPESPIIRIINAECTSIDSGDIEVQYMAKQLVGLVSGFTVGDLENKESNLWHYAIEGVKMMRSQEAEVHNERSVILQWEQMLKDAASATTGTALKLLTQAGSRVDKTLIGDIKKRIYSRKKRDLGSAERNVDSLKMHYNWLQRLNNTMISERVVPQWLR